MSIPIYDYYLGKYSRSVDKCPDATAIEAFVESRGFEKEATRYGATFHTYVDIYNGTGRESAAPEDADPGYLVHAHLRRTDALLLVSDFPSLVSLMSELLPLTSAGIQQQEYDMAQSPFPRIMG